MRHGGTIEPACALAAETLKLERTLSDLVNQAYGLTPADVPDPISQLLFQPLAFSF